VGKEHALDVGMVAHLVEPWVERDHVGAEVDGRVDGGVEVRGGLDRIAPGGGVVRGAQGPLGGRLLAPRALERGEQRVGLGVAAEPSEGAGEFLREHGVVGASAQPLADRGLGALPVFSGWLLLTLGMVHTSSGFLPNGLPETIPLRGPL